MTEKVCADLDYDVPVFRSLGMKLPETISYDKKDDLNNIDITEIYQREPFNNNEIINNVQIKNYSKTSFLLIILVFIILVIITYHYYYYIKSIK